MPAGEAQTRWTAMRSDIFLALGLAMLASCVAGGMPPIVPLGQGHVIAGEALSEYGIREGTRLPQVALSSASKAVNATLLAVARRFQMDSTCTTLYAGRNRYVVVLLMACDGRTFVDGEVVSVLRPDGTPVIHIQGGGGDLIRECTRETGRPCELWRGSE